MRTLFISDLDGTLLNRNASISNYSFEKLNKLINDGILFSFATARSVGGAKKVLNNLNVNLPVIVSNGVKIVNFSDEEVVNNYYFTDSDVCYIKEMSIKYDCLPIVYQYNKTTNKDKFYYLDYKISEGKKYYLDNRKDDPRIKEINTIDELFPEDVFYFTFIDSYENLVDIYNVLKDKYTCIFQQEIYREEYWLEVIPNNINKGIALKKLKEMLKIDKVVYFGDSLNDIYAFNYADIKVAVKNAKKEVLDVADIIIDSNDNDGVVRFIEEYVNNNL